MWDTISWTNLQDLLMDMGAILVVTIVALVWAARTSRQAAAMYGPQSAHPGHFPAPEPGPYPPVPPPDPEPPAPLPGPPHPEPGPPGPD